MILVVDDKPYLNNSYYLKLTKQGISTDGLTEEEFTEWIDYVSDEDVSAVEAFILCNPNSCKNLSYKLRKRSDAPVLALFEDSTVDETIALLQGGVDDVISRPIDIREVIARVAAISRRGKGSLRVENASKKFGAIEVFNDGRDPKIFGEDFVLPRRERRILEFLVANGNTRVSKGQVFNAVYGLFEAEVEENVIESHISKLRKKLKSKFGYDVIDSKRFLGYRLNIPN